MEFSNRGSSFQSWTCVPCCMLPITVFEMLGPFDIASGYYNAALRDRHAGAANVAVVPSCDSLNARRCEYTND